jgi:hypothetical protein
VADYNFTGGVSAVSFNVYVTVTDSESLPQHSEVPFAFRVRAPA